MVDVMTLLSPISHDMAGVEDKIRSGVAARYEEFQAVIDYLMGAGGKRLRPAITLLAANVYPVDKDKSYALAASIELLHTATLVHDDIIDNSLLRRGFPTLNASWSVGATILTGDYMFARSAELSAETESLRIVTAFSHTLMTIVAGELQQIFSDGKGRIPTMAEYEQRIYAKTASLFATGTECGAVLCGASENEVQALRDYGYYLGMAFQVVDDILDFQADEDAVGKPVANDLRLGIATLPAMLFAEQAPNHPTMLKALSRDKVEDEAMLALVEEIRASGSVKGAMEQARVYARKAQETLEILPISPYRQSMHGLAEYAVARDI